MKVALVNKSDAVSDAAIIGAAASLDLQVKQDFFPFWNIKVDVVPIKRSGIAPHGSWPINILDDSDVQGALGYHEYTSRGPKSKVFARTSLYAGVPWSSVASHELLEMLADPQGVLAALDYTT